VEALALITASIIYTNANILTSPSPIPESFYVTEQREAFGTTTEGIPFSQTNIVNEVTRLQKFQIQEAYWYISDRGEIWADTDTQALSIYLTR